MTEISVQKRRGSIIQCTARQWLASKNVEKFLVGCKPGMREVEEVDKKDYELNPHMEEALFGFSVKPWQYKYYEWDLFEAVIEKLVSFGVFVKGKEECSCGDNTEHHILVLRGTKEVLNKVEKEVKAQTRRNTFVEQIFRSGRR